ncbi:MAG: site-2 protease family protein [Candidatus Aminicenantes bacterium]|nr:site-2 protease family protein [Candidatus Aminicenantes bacterium]
MSCPSDPVAGPAGLASPVPRRRESFFAKDRPWVNAVLFLLTFATAFFVGTSWGLNFLYAGKTASDPGFQPEVVGLFSDSRLVGLSILYAAVLMTILLAHEMGHYLACRHYGLSATLPFFIPAPTLIGTLGAFIKIRTPIVRKRVLFDIGAAGPLAGFALAVPALLVGLALSRTVPAVPQEGSIVFGEPLLVRLGVMLFLKDAGPGMDIIVHPIAFAGWVGMLVTSLNLIPLGQLDGGHIAYAVFGARSRSATKIVMGLLALAGIFFWAGWMIWFLILLMMGLRHPRVYDESDPLDRKRTIVAVLIAVIFILSFIPAPIQDYNMIELARSIWP